MHRGRAENIKSSVICMLIIANLVLGFRMFLQYGAPDSGPQEQQVLAAQSVAATYDAKVPVAERLLFLINEARMDNNVPALAPNGELEAVAKLRAADMVSRNYYAHKDPSGKMYHDYFTDDSFRTVYTCENLDLQFTPMPEKYIADWVSSNAGHRECLLNPAVTDVGIAVVEMSPSPNAPTQYMVVAIHAARQK